MRIALLAAGAGPMYCGSCLQANTLVTALRALAVDALLVPLYTPLRTDEPNAGVDFLAFGALNVYLKERLSLFRHTPRVVEQLFDSPQVMRWLNRRNSHIQPRQLGALTVSMLRGETGRQRKELDKLVRWLAEEQRPEVVHLSNVLLVGIAGEIKRKLNVPVVSSLAGEDLFLDSLPSPYREEAITLLRRRVNDLAALIAPSNYYADFMSEYLGVARQRIEVIRPGLHLEGHGVRSSEASDGGMSIGCLARICPAKGLHNLVDAWQVLDADKQLPSVRLCVAGYLDAADRPYFDELRRRIRTLGLHRRFEYMGELSRSEKIEFLQSLHLMCLPTDYREPKSLPVLEAWANGVPVVVPEHGAFTEMVADTGGGLLYEPGNTVSLTAALQKMIEAGAGATECGRQARQVVHARYDAPAMARQTVALYRRILGKQHDTFPGLESSGNTSDRP